MAKNTDKSDTLKEKSMRDLQVPKNSRYFDIPDDLFKIPDLSFDDMDFNIDIDLDFFEDE